MTLYAFFGALEQGLVYALMVLGVYLTFRVLDFPDLTVDGTLPLGAAVTGVLVVQGYNPWMSLGAAMLAGALAGCMTAVLATKLKIMSLLAGIITMTALYSINLRIMGRPNLTLLNQSTILSTIPEALALPSLPGYVIAPLAFLVIVICCKVLLDVFLHTELGMALRATGDNPQMAKAQGINTDAMIIIGVAVSNALVALCGGLVAQSQGFSDVGMGIGTIVAGLASIIIGERLVGERSVERRTLSAVCGSILYRLTIAFALSLHGGFLHLTPSDLNLITAVLVVLCLTFPLIKSRLRRARV